MKKRYVLYIPLFTIIILILISIISGNSIDKWYHQYITTVNKPAMQKEHQNEGGCDTPTPSTSNTPQHDSSAEKPAHEKEVGIGMPVSAEEMERMKKEAEKPDR